MPRLHLTDISVRALKPSAKQLTYWDTQLPAFGVRVSPRGAKAWVIMTGRDRKLVTFGRYPDISLKDARVEAKKRLTTSPKLSEAIVTLDDALTLFLADRERSNRDRTFQDYKRLLNRHFSSLKGTPLSDVTTQQIMKLVDDLADTPSEQHHAFVAVKTMLRFCVGRGFRLNSPLEAVRAPQRPKTRERVLSDVELTKILSTALAENGAFNHIVLLCLFTGMRRTEAAGLRWDWIDQPNRTITLPGHVTKNKREHVFPYGQAVTDLLAFIPTEDGYLFPGRDSPNQFFNGWSRGKVNFDKKCGVEDWSLHDLRRTFATNLAALGTPIHVTEKLLNHVSGTTGGLVGIYQRHAYWDEQKAALQAWEKKLQSLVRPV